VYVGMLQQLATSCTSRCPTSRLFSHASCVGSCRPT